MAESVVISKGTDVVNVSITTSGEVNTAQNVGTGAQIFKEKVGADLRFRSVIGGTGITATQNANDVTLDLPQEVATDSAVQFASVNINNQTTITWDNQNKTLTFPTNGVETEIGQQLHTLVYNNTGTTIAKGKIVYITGATGNKKTIALASNATEAGSSSTFGVTEQEIANNSEGFVSTQGLITGLNTSTFAEGAALWLGTAGNFTTTKPLTPAHLVLIGYVVSSNPSNGSIYVKIQNGYELDELHDVLITSPANNQTLVYDSVNQYWKNAKLDISDFTDTGGLLGQTAISSVVDDTSPQLGGNLDTNGFDIDFADNNKATFGTGEDLWIYHDGGSSYIFDRGTGNLRIITNSTVSIDGASGGEFMAQFVSNGAVSLWHDNSKKFDTTSTGVSITGEITTTGGNSTNWQTAYSWGDHAAVGYLQNLNGLTTSDLAEGTNLYYTDARVKTLAANFDGSIIPSADITYDLGSPTKQWRDVYIGPGSLYVNNKKVIEDDSGTITVETDPDQNLRVRTTGTGVTQINSAQAIQLTGTGSADIEFTTSTGQIELNGDVVIDVTKSLSTSTGGTLTVNAPLNLGSNALTAGNVTVTGDLTVSGTTTTINTETLNIADNTVVLNSNYTGSSPSENAGIEIERGTETNKTFLWDESNDRWTIGAETFVAGTVVANLTGNVTGTVSTLSNHDTGDLAEGTNLYYTDTRFDNRLATKSTSDLTEGTNLYYTDTRFDTRLATKSTSDLTEGTNLYYTDTRANSAIDVRVTKSFVENLDIDVDGGTY